MSSHRGAVIVASKLINSFVSLTLGLLIKVISSVSVLVESFHLGFSPSVNVKLTSTFRVQQSHKYTLTGRVIVDRFDGIV